MRLTLTDDPWKSTLYLDWVRSQALGYETQALRLFEQLEERMGRRRLDPEYILGYMRACMRDADLPETHVPWLWDTVAHRLIHSHGRHATAAYQAARAFEAEHDLPRDPWFTVDNTLLLARHGVLPASEVGDHRLRLAELLPAEEAHREFVRFLHARLDGGIVAAGNVIAHTVASVGTTSPANLVTQVRASVQALGMAPGPSAEEVSRVIGGYLARARGSAVPNGLLRAAEKAFAKAPPDPEHEAGIAALFPTTVTDGGGWLRFLENTGIADAMAEGRVRPEGGYSAWLYKFHHMYAHYWTNGCVGTQDLPAELFALLPRIAPRIREEDTPIRLFGGGYGHKRVDARLLTACDDNGIRVDAPEEWTAKIRAAVRRSRTALETPPPERVRAVREQTELLHTVPLGEAERVLDALDLNLTHVMMRTLEGLPQTLDDLDLSGPLARTLRFGIPGEHTWPAFEEAMAEVGARPGGVRGMTSTWPVLTVYGWDTAIAVDHEGRRGSCTFFLREDPDHEGTRAGGTEFVTPVRHTVHYVGGDFLVTWVQDKYGWREVRARAFWTSDPDDVFTVGSDAAVLDNGSAHCFDLGLVLESPDGGRYDNGRVLRPGDRTGVTYAHDHATDGERVWLNSGPLASAGELDPISGAIVASSCPDFLTPDPRLDLRDLFDTRLHLVRLPEGVRDSPLGAKDGLAGARVVWTGPGKEGDYHPARALEGTDGRRAAFGDLHAPTVWGVLRMPGGTDEGLLAFTWQDGHTVIQCRDGGDDSLIWETWAYPKAGLKNLDLVGRRPLSPPPAYWHFLTPNDPASSQALRDIDDGTARELIDVAVRAVVPEDPTPAVALPEVADRISRSRGDAVREALPAFLPGVTDEAVAEGVVWAVLWAAELQLRVTEMSERTAKVRSGALPSPSGEAPDRELSEALSGLVSARDITLGFPLFTGTVAAIAADGARMRGRIGEADRRLSVPNAPATDWPGLFGVLDAAMWRLATGAVEGGSRDALLALVRTWADQPFAEQGTAWVRGAAGGAELAPLLAEGTAVITEPPLSELRSANAPTPYWSHRYLPERRYSYLRPESAPAPAGAEEGEPLHIGRDEAGRLRRFLELLDEHGPVPADPEAVKAFRKPTRVMGAVAEFVLSGHAGRSEELPPKSAAARTEYRKTGATLSATDTARLLGAAMPDDPAELWHAGGTVAAAERMARVWVELLGVRPSKSKKSPGTAADELPDLLKQDLRLGPEWIDTLTDQESADAATRWSRSLRLDGEFGAEVHNSTTGSRVFSFLLDGAHPYRRAASVLAWALTQLPVGHPAQSGAAGLLERITARLRSPGIHVPLRSYFRDVHVSAWGARSGAVPVHIGAEGAWEPGTAPDQAFHDDGLLVFPDKKAHVLGGAVLSTSAMSDPQVLERSLRSLDELGMDGIALEVRQVGVVCGGGLTRMVQRAAVTPVPQGGYEADPRASVPDLVAEVSGTFGVDADAAALYLQLLTLAQPTDRNVRRWNGWTADRHRKAATQLVENGLVEQGKRTRAGRSHFLPGGWTDLRAPFPPMERAKLAGQLIDVDGKRHAWGPFLKPLPVAPPHEMFAEAWRARDTR